MTYALQNADGDEEVPALALASSTCSTPRGLHQQGRLRRDVNAPWGLGLGDLFIRRLCSAISPSVISAMDVITSSTSPRIHGQLLAIHGNPIAIDGLWAPTPVMTVGRAVGSALLHRGSRRRVHGLVGVLNPVPGPATLTLSGLESA